MKNKTKRSLLLMVLVLSVIMSAFAVEAAGYSENESAGSTFSLACVFKGHTWGEWEEITAATCEAPGLNRRACTVCGTTEEQNVESLGGHNVVTLEGYDATCTKNGLTEGTACSVCNEIFVAQTTIPKKGHTKVEDYKKATLSADGSYKNYCKDCDKVFEQRKIERPTSFKLSSTTVTYNEKTRKPTATVKTSSGKELTAGKDYDIKYPSGGCKLPGKYTISLVFKGDYSGTKKLTFTIKPKATTGVKAKTITSSAITLEWTKTTGATGYKVYMYDSSKEKYVLKTSVKENTCKITGLKGNTTYKFKIRAYTKSGDTDISAADSSVLSAKTKIAYGVKLSSSSATLYVGATKTLKAIPTPSSKTVSWKSSDKSIATVSSSGQIKAIKKGTATITAYFKVGEKTYKATCKVTVKNPSVKLDKTSATLLVGKTLTLKATTAPADLKVTWKSSNTSVATVSSTGKVTGKKVGTATVTANITYKGATYKKTCKITVNTVARNITTLLNYIKKNGKINPSGYKYITLEDYDPGYDIYSTYHIFYLDDKDCLEFVLYNYDSTREWISIAVDLDLSGDYMDYSGRVYSDLNNPPSRYPYVTYSLKVVGTISPSEFITTYSPMKYLVENTYPSNQQSYANGILYKYTDKAMEAWDYFVFKVVGLQLSDLGFTNYRA